jgi:hypothetical protein
MVKVNHAMLTLRPKHLGRPPLRLVPVAMRKKPPLASGRLHHFSAGPRQLLLTRLTRNQ